MTPNREEVSKFIEYQLENDTKPKSCGMWHYGRYELRELLDFIYGGTPENENQHIRKYKLYRMDEP